MMLTSWLLNVQRNVSRGFMIEQAEQAERAINQILQASPVGVEFGLATNAVVRLGMDVETTKYLAHVRGAERYRVLIAAGDLDQFALLLSQNPDDLATVIK